MLLYVLLKSEQDNLNWQPIGNQNDQNCTDQKKWQKQKNPSTAKHLDFLE